MALLSLGSVVKISIRIMPIIVDIWVFVSMISFMLVKLSMKHVFLPHRLGIMRRFVGSFVLCFAFGLSLDRVCRLVSYILEL